MKDWFGRLSDPFKSSNVGDDPSDQNKGTKKQIDRSKKNERQTSAECQRRANATLRTFFRVIGRAVITGTALVNEIAAEFAIPNKNTFDSFPAIPTDHGKDLSLPRRTRDEQFRFLACSLASLALTLVRRADIVLRAKLFVSAR